MTKDLTSEELCPFSNSSGGRAVSSNAYLVR